MRFAARPPPPTIAGTNAMARAPSATTARAIRISGDMGTASFLEQLLLLHIGALEGLDEIGLFVEVARALGEIGLGDAGRAVKPRQHAVGVLPQDVVDEYVLGDDDVALHPQNFGYVRDAARAVAQARRLHHHIDR